MLEEPALLGVPSADAFAASRMPLIERYAGGDADGVVRAFIATIGGPPTEAAIDAAMPGAIAQAAKDIDTFFQVEVPALQCWAFSAAEAARIDRPVLSVIGENSPLLFQEGVDLVRSWFPDVEVARITSANHLLHVEQPAAVAAAIAAFLRNHPMSCR